MTSSSRLTYRCCKVILRIALSVSLASLIKVYENVSVPAINAIDGGNRGIRFRVVWTRRAV